jgi:hypothetical protein
VPSSNCGTGGRWFKSTLLYQQIQQLDDEQAAVFWRQILAGKTRRMNPEQNGSLHWVTKMTCCTASALWPPERIWCHERCVMHVRVDFRRG